MPLKNITITVDSDTAARTRVHAAERNMSVSRYVGEVLREKLGKDDAYQSAYRAFLAEKPLRLKGRMLTREEANDRAALRRR